MGERRFSRGIPRRFSATSWWSTLRGCGGGGAVGSLAMRPCAAGGGGGADGGFVGFSRAPQRLIVSCAEALALAYDPARLWAAAARSGPSRCVPARLMAAAARTAASAVFRGCRSAWRLWRCGPRPGVRPCAAAGGGGAVLLLATRPCAAGGGGGADVGFAGGGGGLCAGSSSARRPSPRHTRRDWPWAAARPRAVAARALGYCPTRHPSISEEAVRARESGEGGFSARSP